MTVSRRVAITYDAPDEDTADRYEKALRDFVMSGRDDGCGCCAVLIGIFGQAFSAEPVAPPTEPLVGP